MEPTEKIFKVDSHRYINRELQDLFYQYEKLYGIQDTFYTITQTTEKYIDLEVGIAPAIGEHRTQYISARVRIPADLEDEIEVRKHIPKIHMALIAELHKFTRRELIHRYYSNKEVV